MGIGTLRRHHAKGKAGAPTAPALPDGEPSKKWKVAELKAYAAARGIELDGVTKRADILEVLAQAASTPTPPAGGEGDEGQAGEGNGGEPS